MKPVRKKARLKEMLDARKARRAKGGDQVINTSNTFTTDLEPDDPLFQEIMRAQGPMPLAAAEVVGTPTQYEEADLAKAGLLALRELGGMVPGLDLALDAAEIEHIRRTGKDFYEDEADPNMYAGMTLAGMLLPNIVERPLRAAGKGVKKFIKMHGDALSDSKTLQTLNNMRPSQKLKNKSSELIEDADALANPTPKDVDNAILRGDVANPYDRETHLKAMQVLGENFTPGMRTGKGNWRVQSEYYRYANWVALRRPDLMKRIADGDMKAAAEFYFDKDLAKAYFDETQTTFRGVGIPKDSEIIEEVLINPKPVGWRAYGEGVYTTAAPGKAMTYTDGGTGSVGVLQTDMDYSYPMDLLDKLSKHTQTQGYSSGLREGDYMRGDRVYGLGGSEDVRVYNQFERLGKGRQPAKLKVVDVLNYGEAKQRVKDLNKFGIDQQFWGSKTFDPSKLTPQYLKAMRGGEGFVTAQNELKALNVDQVKKLEEIAKRYEVGAALVQAAELGIVVSPITMAIMSSMEDEGTVSKYVSNNTAKKGVTAVRKKDGPDPVEGFVRIR